MIRVLLFDKTMGLQAEGSEELITDWQENPDSIIWVDFYEVNTDKERQLMENAFGLHPLAITDAQRTRHPAKIEGFSDHTFILFKGLSEDTESIAFATIQVAMFVGKNFLVTRHSDVSVSTDKLWNEVKSRSDKSATLSQNYGPVILAINLMNYLVSRYLPILLDLEKRLEEIESEIIQNPQDALLYELIEHKTNLKKMRRIMTYHNTVFEQLKKITFKGTDQEYLHEINDVHEKLDRAASLTNLYQELATDLQDGYISLAAHKLNNIVKLLTVITVIFIPLGFLAGLYGMNFEYIPELGFHYGYFILLSVMFTIAVGLLILFKRIKWL